MKKTLIALAAVAAATGAMAQATISGKYGVSYQQTIGGVANLATTDGDVRFTATEDLGGGLRATVAMELRVRGRGNVDAGSPACANGLYTVPHDHVDDEEDEPVANIDPIPAGALVNCAATNLGVGARNATVSLSGGFGSVTLGSVEAGNGIIGRAWAGAPIALPTLYDGRILSGVANVDWFQYTSPALAPGLTVNYQRVDSVANPGTTEGTTANVFGANYAQGPLSAGIDYTVFKGPDSKRTRVSASYNFGVAMVGAGYEDRDTTEAQYTLGVSAPVAANIRVGAIWARNKENGRTGYALGADYALSKRTAVNFTYGDVTKGDVADATQYRVRLMHSF